MRRQTIIRRRPPGRVARRRLAIAAAGLVKNIVPKRAKQTSNGCSNFTVCPSASWNAAPATPARAASARPISRNGSQQSIPSALPVARASSMVVSPNPHPTSSTRSPGWTGCISSARWL